MHTSLYQAVPVSIPVFDMAARKPAHLVYSLSHLASFVGSAVSFWCLGIAVTVRHTSSTVYLTPHLLLLRYVRRLGLHTSHTSPQISPKMQLYQSITVLAIWALSTDVSPVEAAAVSSFPDLAPSSPINIATDDNGKQTVSPVRMPLHAITLAKRETTTSSFPDLVPSTTVDLATDSTYTTQNVSPDRNPTSTVVLAAASTTAASGFATSSTNATLSTTTSAAESWQGTSSFPDLVPTTTVNIATDTAGVRTTSKARAATSTASTSTTYASSVADSNDSKKESGAGHGANMPGRWVWTLAASAVFKLVR